MIVCRKCSRRHPDGTEFCVCGAYLEFDGENVPETSATLTPPGSPAAAPPRPPEAPPAAWSAQPPVAASPPRSPTAADPAPWSGFEPTAEPAHPAGGIDAVLPDAPGRAPSAGPVWVEAGGRAGDVVCRQCGTANDPARFFCQHCGMSLTGAVDQTTTSSGRRVPWWRRLFGGARKRVGAADATSAMNRVHGLARGGLSGKTMLFRSGGIMVVLAGFLAFLGPWRQPIMNKGRELLGAERYSAVEVDEDEVTSPPTDPAVVPATFEQQGPENVRDRFSNTAWATRWTGSGPGFEALPDDQDCQPVPLTDSELLFSFTEPLDIDRIRILSGRPDDEEGRANFSRPRFVELRFDDEPCRYAELPDSGELTVIDLGGDDVETVRLRVVGIYEPDDANETVEIFEILFEEG